MGRGARADQQATAAAGALRRPRAGRGRPGWIDAEPPSAPDLIEPGSIQDLARRAEPHRGSRRPDGTYTSEEAEYALRELAYTTVRHALATDTELAAVERASERAMLISGPYPDRERQLAWTTQRLLADATEPLTADTVQAAVREAAAVVFGQRIRARAEEMGDNIDRSLFGPAHVRQLRRHYGGLLRRPVTDILTVSEIERAAADAYRSWTSAPDRFTREPQVELTWWIEKALAAKTGKALRDEDPHRMRLGVAM